MRWCLGLQVPVSLFGLGCFKQLKSRFCRLGWPKVKGTLFLIPSAVFSLCPHVMDEGGFWGLLKGL